MSVAEPLGSRENAVVSGTRAKGVGLRFGGCGAARRAGGASSRGKLTRRVAARGGHRRTESSTASVTDTVVGCAGETSEEPRENGSAS